MGLYEGRADTQDVAGKLGMGNCPYESHGRVHDRESG